MSRLSTTALGHPIPARRAVVPVAAVLCVLLAGCSEPDTLGPEEEFPAGELTVELVRSATGDVPEAADSAFVRVRHSQAGVDEVRRSVLPAVGDSSSVSFELTARTDYSVDAVAFTRDSEITDGSRPEALAAARRSSVEVFAGRTVDVPLQVEPWNLVLSGVPDTLRSGEETTLSGSVTGAPAIASFTSDARLEIDTDEWSGCCPATSPVSGSLDADGAFSMTFTAPTVESDTTAWFRFTFFLEGGEEAWPADADGIAAEIAVPSSTRGEPLLTRPLVVEDEGAAAELRDGWGR